MRKAQETRQIRSTEGEVALIYGCLVGRSGMQGPG
jgi:hypothetical protein